MARRIERLAPAAAKSMTATLVKFADVRSHRSSGALAFVTVRSFTFRSLIVALVALIAAVVLAPVAQGQWSPPATISTPHTFINELQLASGPAGDLLVWKHEDVIPAKEIAGAPGANDALAAPGGVFGRERRLPASYATGPTVNLGGGHLAQLILLRTGINTDRAEVALGTVGGGFNAPLPVPGASVEVGRASLAGNAHGELLLSWVSADVHGYHRVVWASVRPPGRWFGAPRIISSSAEAEQVKAAVGPQGDMLVAFPSKYGRMLARVRRHGQGWGSLQYVGPAAGGNENDLTPFVSARGRIILAWYETQLSEGGEQYPGFVRVAVQPAGKDRFRPQQVLERDATPLTGAPIGGSLAPLVLSVGGHAPMVIFLGRGERQPTTSPLETPAVVKVAYPNGLAFAASQAISPAGAQADDVAAAAAPNGAIITWVSGSYDTGTAYASLLPSVVGRFGSPAQISPDEHVLSAMPGYSPAGIRWIVAWTSHEQYQSELEPGPLSVRASFCQALC